MPSAQTTRYLKALAAIAGAYENMGDLTQTSAAKCPLEHDACLNEAITVALGRQRVRLLKRLDRPTDDPTWKGGDTLELRPLACEESAGIIRTLLDHHKAEGHKDSVGLERENTLRDLLEDVTQTLQHIVRCHDARKVVYWLAANRNTSQAS